MLAKTGLSCSAHRKRNVCAGGEDEPALLRRGSHAVLTGSEMFVRVEKMSPPC